MMYRVTLLGIFSLINCSIVAAAEITFPIHAHAVNKADGSFILGARSKGAKEFALASVDQKNISPLAQEKVMVSDLDDDAEQLTKEVPNPLFDQPISHIATFANNSHIIVASPTYPACIYLVEKKSSGIPELLISKDIKDSNEKTITEIVSLVGSDQSYVFAAIKTDEQRDGIYHARHEIALLQLQQHQQENKSIRFGFKQVSSNPLEIMVSEEKKISFSDGAITDMWWDSTLKLLYVLVCNELVNSEESHEKYTLLSAAIAEGALVFKTVAPHSVDENNDSSSDIAINLFQELHKVRTLYTSTKLSYLLVLNNERDTLGQQLCALPVCNMQYKNDNMQFHGMIAHKESSISSVFLVNNRVPAIQGRYFELPLSTREDRQEVTSPSVLVGGGQLKEGLINDIFVEGDAVYVTVFSPAKNNMPGLFVSQPIFDYRGAIINWTSWQRVAGITQPVARASLNYKTGNITFLSHGIDDACVEETSWAMGKEDGFKPVAHVLQEYFSAQRGGIHGCFDFSYKHDALSHLSMMICTGYKKIALIQTGSLNDSVLQITPHGTETYVNKQGAFESDIKEKVALISGGALDALDMITSAECICDGTHGFLCVGGVKGLAILMHENGAGWNRASSLNEVSSLVEGMSFKRIGNYTFVRKLIYDRGCLYVLTDTLLDRIDIQASNFVTNDLKITTLATARNFQNDISCAFTDCIVSEKCALLGTNKGLWRSGNGVDIAQVSSKEAVNWHYQHLLDGSDNIIQLRAVTASHCEHDCARGDGSMIYVLNGYYGHAITYIHRFALRDTVTNNVADYTFLPIPDYKLFQRFPYYHRYVGFKNQLGIDGAYCLTGQNCNRTGDNADNPIFGLTPMQGVGLHMPLVFSEQDEIISTIVRNSASGSWVVTGNFGLHLNE